MRTKFLNINILHGGSFFDPLIDFILKENPDILAMQEVQETQGNTSKKHFKNISLFKKILPYKYFNFSPELSFYEDGLKIEHGNAIFSRFPIKSSKTIFFDLPYATVNWEAAHKAWNFEHFPKNMQCLEILVDSSLINAFNLHGIWGRDGKDNVRRLKMGETIVEHARNKKKLILAGDFNLQPKTKTIASLEKILKNIFKDELQTTFNSKRKNNPEFATVVVDMIFVSSDIKVVEHYCPQVDISDHLPLVAVLEI